MVKTGKEFEIKLTNGDVFKLHIKHPSQRDVFELDKEYRKAMSQLLKEGVITQYKLAEILKKNGEWTDSDENDMVDYGKLLAIKLKDFNEDKNNRSEKENTQLAENIMDWRSKHMAAISRKHLLFDSSAERQADNHRMHTYARLCCVKEDGTPFFKDEEHYDEFNQNEPVAASRIMEATFAFEYNTDLTNAGKDWDEVVYLNEIKNKNGKKLNEQQENKPSKKKRGRKPKVKTG